MQWQLSSSGGLKSVENTETKPDNGSVFSESMVDEKKKKRTKVKFAFGGASVQHNLKRRYFARFAVYAATSLASMVGIEGGARAPGLALCARARLVCVFVKLGRSRRCFVLSAFAGHPTAPPNASRPSPNTNPYPTSALPDCGRPGIGFRSTSRRRPLATPKPGRPELTGRDLPGDATPPPEIRESLLCLSTPPTPILESLLCLATPPTPVSPTAVRR